MLLLLLIEDEEEEEVREGLRFLFLEEMLEALVWLLATLNRLPLLALLLPIELRSDSESRLAVAVSAFFPNDDDEEPIEDKLDGDEGFAPTSAVTSSPILSVRDGNAGAGFPAGVCTRCGIVETSGESAHGLGPARSFSSVGSTNLQKKKKQIR